MLLSYDTLFALLNCCDINGPPLPAAAIKNTKAQLDASEILGALANDAGQYSEVPLLNIALCVFCV